MQKECAGMLGRRRVPRNLDGMEGIHLVVDVSATVVAPDMVKVRDRDRRQRICWSDVESGSGCLQVERSIRQDEVGDFCDVDAGFSHLEEERIGDL